MNLNSILFEWIGSVRGSNVFLDTVAAFFASPFAYFFVLLAAYAAYETVRSRRLRIFSVSGALLAVMLSCGIIVNTIHAVYTSQGPREVLNLHTLIQSAGASFPSGHAALLFGLAMAIFYNSKQWGTWFFAGAILNGIARIYVGVHWPFDIAGGAIIGILGAYLVHTMLAPYANALKEKQPAVN